MAIELVLERAVLQAGVDDVLDRVNVEGEVGGRQFRREKVADILEEFLGGRIEGG